MFYNHQEIDRKWQSFWKEKNTFRAENITENGGKPKFYVLDMFPYPSGAGLHVGHPLGYIASDIYSRYKRHQGYNVLHPIGYDSFGLPAEQYAIQTGQHPALTTEVNINRYEEQLRKIGFSFDWSREIRTSDSLYYRWTQWIFVELFHSWYNKTTDRAEPITTLVSHFEVNGTKKLSACQTQDVEFSAEQWNAFSEEKKQEVFHNFLEKLKEIVQDGKITIAMHDDAQGGENVDELKELLFQLSYIQMHTHEDNTDKIFKHIANIIQQMNEFEAAGNDKQALMAEFYTNFSQELFGIITVLKSDLYKVESKPIPPENIKSILEKCNLFVEGGEMDKYEMQNYFWNELQNELLAKGYKFEKINFEQAVNKYYEAFKYIIIYI